MFFLFELLADGLSGVAEIFDSTDYRRCKRAYRSAWKQASGATQGSEQVLREAFKAEHVTHIYRDPDGPGVAPWLTAWSEGLNPRDAARSVRANR